MEPVNIAALPPKVDVEAAPMEEESEDEEEDDPSEDEADDGN